MENKQMKDYCTSCGNQIVKGEENYKLDNQYIDGFNMYWKVCKKCYTYHSKKVKNGK